MIEDIRFNCRHCRSHLVVETRGAGWIVPCPKCGLEITIPQPDEVDSPDSDTDNVVALARTFPLFHGLNQSAVERILSYFQSASFARGEDVLVMGEPAKSFFIILKGTVVILGEKDVVLASLAMGDVFGEMGLLSGDPVSATVRSTEPVQVLHTSDRNFHTLLRTFPPLTLFFSGLLAGRLTRKNLERAQDLASGMSGMLSEIMPADLIQTLHQSHKTGVLCLYTQGGDAKLFFEYGHLIAAEYGNDRGREAVFKLLGENEGRFSYSAGLDSTPNESEDLGDVGWLLMEGFRRLDEGRNASADY